MKRILLFLAVFGPVTITSMANNDTTGVAIYSISGAQLVYPILFLLLIITVLRAITQEMVRRLKLFSCLFFFAYIFSADKASSD